MRKVMPTIVALLSVMAAAACTRPTGPTTVDAVHNFPVTPGKVVRVELRSLDLEVRVAEREDIRAALWLQARSSSSAAARRWVERSTPTFEDSESTLEIRQPASSGVFLIGFLDTRGHLELEVPPGCELDVTTASGDVGIDGTVMLAGTVKVRTASGDLHVEGGVRDLAVRTASGDVRITGEPLSLLDAETASGDIRLEAGALKVLADTASGDLRLRHLGGDLSADTTSGDLSARWDELSPSVSVRISTASGDVVLRIPREVDPVGELHATSGEVRTSFEGSWDRRHKRLTMAGTGPSITVRTASGDISLRSGG